MRRIIDVRFEWEAREYPSPFHDDPVYRNVPIEGEDPDLDLNGAEDYGPALDRYPGHVAAAFTALAEAPPGPVMVHCNMGRDRAGTLVALALSVAGADVETIVADYALSGEAVPETMRDLLVHLDERYGGVRDYLAAAGVSETQLDTVAARLVDLRALYGC